jgi:N-acetylmuramoyl-L-alanine amidase
MHRLVWLIGVVLLVGCATKRVDRVERLDAPPAPPPMIARPELPPRPSAAPLVVLDAGHGGHDDGARCVTPPYPEKRATLQLAQLVQKRLTALGYRVALTRCQDLFLSLHERALLANQKGASAFVSLHFNHCSNPTAKGLEVFYCVNDPMLKRDLLSKELADSVLRHTLDNTHAKDRGVKEASFVVIRTTAMPSILVEGGFLSNQDEGRMISELPYLERMAQGIALGVHHYFVHAPDADAPVSVYSEVAGRRAPPVAKAKTVASPKLARSSGGVGKAAKPKPAPAALTKGTSSPKKPAVLKPSKAVSARG